MTGRRSSHPVHSVREWAYAFRSGDDEAWRSSDAVTGLRQDVGN